MKKTILYLTSIFVLACAAVACVESEPETVPAPEVPDTVVPDAEQPSLIPGTLSAAPVETEPESKATLDGTSFSWSAGDQLAVFQYFPVLEPAESNIVTTLTKSSADDNLFTGNFPYTTPADSYGYCINVVYPASMVTGLVKEVIGTTSYVESFNVALPSTQDGRLSHFGNYFLTSAFRRACEVTVEDGVITQITVPDVALNRHIALGIKTVVPQGLDIVRIQLRAMHGASARGLAGTGMINVHNSQTKRNQLSNQVLTIEREDNSVIEGDTYASIVPFAINASACDVDRIELKLINSSAQEFTFSKTVSGLQRGVIYNLGTLPSACVTPKFSFNEDGDVEMATAPAEASIYYTTDGTDPSASPTRSLYSGPVSFEGEVTFKAVATCAGLPDSGIAEVSIGAQVQAPVLAISAGGELVIEEPNELYSYKYSVSTTGAPSEPNEDFPGGGIDLVSTGTYYVKVTASDGISTATTNALYRVYFLDSALPVGSRVDLNAETPVDDATFAPFIATRFASDAYAEQTCSFTRGTNGAYWKTAWSGPSNYCVFLGLETRYDSTLSMSAYSKGASNVYPRYCGVRNGTTDDGVEVPGSIQNALAAATWSAFWTINATAGNMVEFAVPNGREMRGFTVLEQGFDGFSPISSAASTQTPVQGAEVSY